MSNDGLEADLADEIEPMLSTLERFDPMARALFADMLKRIYALQLDINGRPGLSGIKGKIDVLDTKIDNCILAVQTNTTSVERNTASLNTVLQNARLKESPAMLVVMGAVGWTFVVIVFAGVWALLHRAGVFS